MADWVIWYQDESSFSSDDGLPQEAPTDGVICLAVSSIECGNYLLHVHKEQNFYCWHQDEDPPQWVPHDADGLRQYKKFTDKKDWIILHGYWIGRPRYGRMVVRAQNDPRLPELTANPPRSPEGE